MPRPESARTVQNLPPLTPEDIAQLTLDEARGFAAKVDKLLTKKTRAFVREYLRSRNSAWAAKAAGYRQARGEVMGAELLARPSVNMAVLLGERIAQVLVDVDTIRVARELAAIGLANFADAIGPDGKLTPIEELPRELAACVTAITTDKEGRVTSYKLGGKLEALERLGKYFGMFREITVRENPDGSAVDEGGDRALAMAMIRLAHELGVSVDRLLEGTPAANGAALPASGDNPS